MRLSNNMRAAFIRQVMDDTPHPDNNTVKTELQAALVEAMSPAAREAYLKAPKALCSMHTDCVFIRDSHRFVVGDANFKEVAQPWVAAIKQRITITEQLRSVVYGCNTVKQLRQILPEFERYMPSESEPTKNLPAVTNVVTTLVTLGWPKEGGVR